MATVAFSFVGLSLAPSLLIEGMVTNESGRPLSRRVILYNASGDKIAETESDARGHASFRIEGAGPNDRFVVRAIGHVGECDDISCPLGAANG